MRPMTSATSSVTSVIGCWKKLPTCANRPVAGASTSGGHQSSLPAAALTVQISCMPPGTVDHTITTVAARPPNMMQNCTTSFQITA